jgi:pimeloyl-ACP methyl ester carboxylesterase
MMERRLCEIALKLTILMPLVGGAFPSQAIASSAASPASAVVSWYETGLGRLKAKEFLSAQRNDGPTLIVVLHGDAPQAPPTYQYRFASQAASQLDNVVVAAILRPGYWDGDDRSDGTKGMMTGDNYTPSVIDAVGDVVEALKLKYHPDRVVIVGHSGGAAISADLLGRRPAGIKAALLVSCPCDVPKWRQYMKSVQGGAIWDAPISSLSPMDMTAAVPRSVRVKMIVGAEDHVAPPEFTLAYAAALQAHGVSTDATVEPSLPHNILLEPAVFDALRELVRTP